MADRRIVYSALTILAMVAMMWPSTPMVASAQPSYPRDALRLRSGGVASQVAGELDTESFSPSPSRDRPPFQWSKNVNVFPNPFEQDEPTIAVNPADPQNIVVGNHERQGLSPKPIVCAFQASFDEGASWTRFGQTPLQGPNFVRGVAGGHSCSDSVLAADRGGDFFFAYLDLFRTAGGGVFRVDVLVAKSTDGGQTFSSPTLVSKGTIEDPDKEWFEVDRHPQSPFLGDVYATYTDFSDLATPDVGAVIRFRKSTDGGATFQPNPQTTKGTRVSDFGDFGVTPRPDICSNCFDFLFRYMQGSNIAVGPKGEINVFYGDFTEIETFNFALAFPASFINARMTAAKIMAAKSTDGGLTWTRSVVRDMCNPMPCRSAGTDAHETKNTPVFRVGTIPFGGVSPDGKFTYAIWAEWNNVAFSFDPATNRDFAVSRGNIMFARSTDGGTTWESATQVNDDTGVNDKYQPAMVVRGGTIHAVWVDRRLDPAGRKYDIFYATSTDNGRSFHPNVRVTTASSNPTGTSFVGDYIGIDGARGPMQVHAVWTDRRAVATSASSAGNDVFTAERLMPPP